MRQEAVLVLDCGATNVRAIALDRQGRVIANAAVANASRPAAENPAWHNWSLDDILARLQTCCRHIAPQTARLNIRALTVTTFGVDGALTDENGELLYPIISWKCPRTLEMMAQAARDIAPDALQTLSGIGQFSFNTLYKLLWLKQYHPALLEKAHAWLFISSLINQRLTGEFTTDRTMAGTSQLLDVRRERFSEVILQRAGLSPRLFPRMVSAGEMVGVLQPALAAHLGLSAGIPVISAGHDTQFALFGSGAGLLQPVLSSGTWEILMVRTPQVDTAQLPRYDGSTCELDSQPGLFNPGLQWLASGVLEWLRRLLWREASPPAVYQSMDDEAAELPPGAGGVRMDCGLLGPARQAGWRGVTLDTTRGHLYRAALESLSGQLRRNLDILQSIGAFQARELLLVGGGSRNALWSQIKADILGLPVKVLEDAETTVLGAAMFAWAGCGAYPSPEHARAQVDYRYRYYYPGVQRAAYQALASEAEGV
ncbi:L-fuculokinase [Affinibrenneria salicis]|uniref:L-fuculokinase n=1 Tax=Affinibrenneria salicis TaxID=2590031 RepID=A0A5J5G6W7_9GAMM|nr:L-fuculokinase [Affinibrenneria salicis]KAA9002794.1 L-fuculokinase [Affinibrenneria salicis]KAA9002919.1 L-fuculokinase [Affinibrenneria salicis]